MIEIIYYQDTGGKRGVKIDNKNDSDWDKTLKKTIDLLIAEIKS